MNTLTISNSVAMFAAAVRLSDIIPVADLDAGCAQLAIELEEIALSAEKAQRQGVSLRSAVADAEHYPQLARIHTGINDILTLSLPPVLVKWLSAMLSAPEPPSFDAIRTALVSLAADSTQPRMQALARFALFEGVRLNLVVMVKWDARKMFGAGVEMSDLDGIAEERVMKWLATGVVVPHGVRPFNVIVKAAQLGLLEHKEMLRDSLRRAQQDFVNELNERAEIEELLGAMDVRDAILVRNEVASELDEQRLTIELLQERHAVAFGGVSSDALYQRVKRARKKPAARSKRRSVALLDLLRDIAPGGVL